MAKSVMCVLTFFLYSAPGLHAASYFVDNQNPACSDSGPGTEAQPFCTVQRAADTTRTGDIVYIKPGIYRGGVRENTAGTTWKGMGATPDDVKMVLSVSVKEMGWGITKTSGFNNVYEFNPGKLISSVQELNRPTDLNRREPSKFTNSPSTGAPSTDLNGVDGYFAWHTRDSWAKDYFGTDFGDPPIEPPNVQAALKVVDAVEGSWIQDDADWTDSKVVYFHPRGQRDGRFVDLEAGVFEGPACEFMRENTIVSNLSCYGTDSGNPGRIRFKTGTKGGDPLRIGGSGSKVSNIRTYAGRAWIMELYGLTNFHLRHFLFTGGLNINGRDNTQYSAIVIEDGEVVGGTSGFSWEFPWGTSASPAVLRRVVLHDTESWRFQDIGYDWKTDTFNDRGVPGQHRHTHGPAFGGTGTEITENVIIENNVIYGQSDGLRVLNCQRNCVVRNNIILGSFNTGVGNAPSAAGAVKFYNNALINGVMLCSRPNCAEFASANNNFYLDRYDGGPIGDPFVAIEQSTDVDYTWSQWRSFGFDANGILVPDSLEQRMLYFQDPSTTLTGTGGDDYRLAAASPLIDAGNDANCGHAILLSKCDIGAYEFGVFIPTGPDPIHSEVLFGNVLLGETSSRPSSPTNLRLSQ